MSNKSNGNNSDSEWEDMEVTETSNCVCKEEKSRRRNIKVEKSRKSNHKKSIKTSGNECYSKFNDSPYSVEHAESKHSPQLSQTVIKKKLNKNHKKTQNESSDIKTNACRKQFEHPSSHSNLDESVSDDGKYLSDKQKCQGFSLVPKHLQNSAFKNLVSVSELCYASTSSQIVTYIEANQKIVKSREVQSVCYQNKSLQDPSSDSDSDSTVYSYKPKHKLSIKDQKVLSQASCTTDNSINSLKQVQLPNANKEAMLCFNADHMNINHTMPDIPNLSSIPTASNNHQNFSNNKSLINCLNSTTNLEPQQKFKQCILNSNNVVSRSDKAGINTVCFQTEALQPFQLFNQNRDNSAANLKHQDSLEIYFHCRQELDKISEESIAKVFEEKEKLLSCIRKGNLCCKSIFKHRLQNLDEQQNQFELAMQQAKNQFTPGSFKSSEAIIKACEAMKTLVSNECKLFQKFFPAYAFRGNILTSLAKKRVLVLSADQSYGFNVVLPIILRRQFPWHFIVSCQKTEIHKEWLEWSLNKLEQGVSSINNNKSHHKETFVMTEKEMLNYSSNREYFAKKTIFVIYQISLNRTVNSDILLSNFRDMLKRNGNSRLILLTAPQTDASKYKKYFSELKVSDIKAQSLIFPVTCVWKNKPLTPEEDHIQELVKTILSIYVLNQPGNILAFVPSVEAAKSASKLLKQTCLDKCINDIYDIILDGNYFFTRDFILSQKSSKSKIVYLSTESAETIPIPSVKHIIDCGISTNYYFDPRKNTDVLKTVFISSLRADVHKSLAGVYEQGTCYKLYSKVNYIEDMPNNDCPEVLCRNPLRTLVKALKYKPNTLVNSIFVDPLPKMIVTETLQSLEKYGAINNNTVTDFGECIIKLPFEAKYSKIISMGMDLGLAFEAVILTSFFTVEGELFEYSDKEKCQGLFDAKQIGFAQHNSETLTYLLIYKTCMKKNFDLTWCQEHNLNIEFLKKVQQKIDKICEIIFNCTKIRIHFEYSKLDDWPLILTEMLFNYLQQNLCVFSGRLECGFRVLSTNSIAYLRPHSVIHQKDNIPQFLIFDRLLSLDKDYLVNVTAIPSDLIMKGLSNNTLTYDCDKLFDNTLVSHTIKPVGKEVLHHVFLENDGEKLQKVIEQIKIECGSDVISVEPSVEKECVYIYALPKFIDAATLSMQSILTAKFEKFVNECQLDDFELVKDQNSVLFKVQWSKGALTTSVKIDSDPRTSNINESLSKFPFSLYISWIRRPCTGHAFAVFSSDTDLEAIKHLSMKHITLFHSELFMLINKDKPNQLCISGLPPKISKKVLEKELKNLISNSKIDHLELMHIPPFETPYHKFQLLKCEITDICKNLLQLDSFEVVMEHPKPQDLNIKVCIRTNNCKALSSVSGLITEKLSNEKQLVSEHQFGLQIKCNTRMCQTITPLLVTTLKHLETELKSQNDKNKLDSYIENLNKYFQLICAKSSNIEIIQTAHDTINNLLKGKIIAENDTKDLKKLFCHGGYIWLRGLEAEENICIIEDNRKILLRIYGSPESFERSKQRVVQFLKESENDVDHIIQLYNEKSKNLLLKTVIEEYGVDLRNLIEKCKLHSALLDIRTSKIHLCGKQKSIDMASNYIENLRSSLNSANTRDLLSQEICPVCVCSAVNPTYRLGHCGHLYCQSCIQALIEWDNFPIQCIAKDCHKELVLKDIRNILLNDTERLNKLLKKSIDFFLEKNILNVMYCPASECPMFFFKSDLVGERKTCKLCQSDICIRCNSIYHAGFTCDLYQSTKPNVNAPCVNGKTDKKLSCDPSNLEQQVPPGKGSTSTAEEDKPKECTGTCVMLKSVPGHHKYKQSFFQPINSKAFLKAIQKEMKILKSTLPEGISVKSYEDRMDLYSVLIKGPKGTPYEDGLFFFDVQFPANYPNMPPLFHYISYCHTRINPNLYEGGKVCVSLLGTWSGKGSELWNPKTSNLLQVLVSIQGLILVSEPYFNEPGYEPSKGSSQGLQYSKAYNEMVVLNLVKGMSKLLVSPPKEFQEEVIEHFEICSSKMIERLEAWVKMSETKPTVRPQKLKPQYPPFSTSSSVLYNSGFHHNKNYLGYYYDQIYLKSHNGKVENPSPSHIADAFRKEFLGGYPGLQVTQSHYPSASASANASKNQGISAGNFSDNNHMPEFPLIPASQGFCLSIKEALANFKGLLPSLNKKPS